MSPESPWTLRGVVNGWNLNFPWPIPLEQARFLTSGDKTSRWLYIIWPVNTGGKERLSTTDAFKEKSASDALIEQGWCGLWAGWTGWLLLLHAEMTWYDAFWSRTPESAFYILIPLPEADFLSLVYFPLFVACINLYLSLRCSHEAARWARASDSNLFLFFRQNPIKWDSVMKPREFILPNWVLKHLFTCTIEIFHSSKDCHKL